MSYNSIRPQTNLPCPFSKVQAVSFAFVSGILMAINKISNATAFEECRQLSQVVVTSSVKFKPHSHFSVLSHSVTEVE